LKNGSYFKKGFNLIDISTPLYNDMEKYPSLEGFQLQWIRTIWEKDKLNMSRIAMESHVGTHVDAPLHFIENGKSIDQMPLQNLFGAAQVLDVPYPETVTGEFLRGKHLGTHILLFKFGEKRYSRDFDYFDFTAVDYLLQNDVKVIGTDNFTIDSKKTKYDIHQSILKNEIWVVEGLNLTNVIPGVYEFICLPLSIKSAEGSPARAVLLKRESEK